MAIKSEIRTHIAYHASLLFLSLLVIGALFMLKSKAALVFWDNPFFLFYTFLLVIFQLSRLASALLYRSSYLHMVSMYDTPFSEAALHEPTVSFVIPCKNEEGAIAKTITKCFEAEYPDDKKEVIVINDGSTDKTGDVLLAMKKQYPKLVVITFLQNKGKRRGMVEGFKKATGEIVVQLDSDSYFRPESFRELLKPFKNPEIAAVCAHADPENSDENVLTKMQAAYYYLSFRIMKAAESTYGTVFCLSGCSSAYRRDIVLPVLEEFLDEKFLGLPITWGDDRALTNLVLRMGYKTVYTDEARACTIVPNTMKQLITQQIRWKKGWFVNSLRASRFIYKIQPFVTFTYFWPLILLTLLTPFMALRALVYSTVWLEHYPFYYFFGVFLVTSLYLIAYRYTDRTNKYWPYYYLWSILNTVFLCFLLPYALLTIQNRKWGTR